jgi:hypothetical protein
VRVKHPEKSVPGVARNANSGTDQSSTCDVQLHFARAVLHPLDGPLHAVHDILVKSIGDPGPEEAAVRIRPRALPPAPALGRMHSIPRLLGSSQLVWARNGMGLPMLFIMPVLI